MFVRVGQLLKGKNLILALIAISLVFNFNVVADSNTPPTKPVLIGVNSGKVNTTYSFTALSIDPEEDQIKYAFSFGDNADLVFSDFLTSGTSYTVSHSWESPGIYTVKVNAKDEQNSFSDTTELTVLINAKFVGFLGYIVDSDSDGVYDSFFSNSTGEIASIERFDIYLIDIDNDGVYDYRYNTNNEEIQNLKAGENTQDDVVSSSEYSYWIPLIFFVCIVFIVSLFFILIFKTKKPDGKEKKPTTNFSYLKNKKEVVEEKPVFVDNLKKEFDNVIFEKELKVEKSKNLVDIKKYIDKL